MLFSKAAHTPTGLTTPTGLRPSTNGSEERKWRGHFLDAMYLREKADGEKKVRPDETGDWKVGSDAVPSTPPPSLPLTDFSDMGTGGAHRKER